MSAAAPRSVTAAGNQPFGSLPARERSAVLNDLEPVALVPCTTLHHAGEPLDHFYFVNSGVIGLLDAGNAVDGVEVAMVGSEGVVGLELLLEEEKTRCRAHVRVAGTAMRIVPRTLHKHLGNLPHLRKALQRCTSALIAQLARAAACNALHEAGPRLAKWLLMTQDRATSVQIETTQDAIAACLGVRRAAVSSAIRDLQRNRSIRSGRGNVVILDRPALIEASCSCYQQIFTECFRRPRSETVVAPDLRTGAVKHG